MEHDPDEFFNQMMESELHVPKSREEYVRAPFGWPGGKWHSLEHLLRIIPVRKTWVEVCGGSGILSLNRRPSTLEVFNDRHAGVTAFYRCIRDPIKFRELVNRLRLIVHSREEFVWCRDSWDSMGPGGPHNDIERAARWYYMVRMSFSQLGRNFGRATSGRPQQAKAINRSVNRFGIIHDRFSTFQIENLDAIQCIRDYDSPDTVFYVDPDYIGTDPGIYAYRVQHELLLDTIENSKGYFAVSGYAHPMYDSRTWDARHTWGVMVSSQGLAFSEEIGRAEMENFADRGKKVEEVLWVRESKE